MLNIPNRLWIVIPLNGTAATAIGLVILNGIFSCVKRWPIVVIIRDFPVPRFQI